MEPFRFHLFVCTQQKPEGVSSCPDSGSYAVLNGLDREIQARGLGRDVQVTTCGCMGLCDEGPVMVVYPEGVWYRRVQPSDIPEIVAQHLLEGKPVDRLIWNDASAMKAMSIEHGEHFRQAMAAREKAGTLPDRLNEMIRAYMPVSYTHLEVVHLFELVEVDVDQPEDAGLEAGFLNLPIQILVQRESVVNVGEQVELRTVEQVGVQAPGLDGQSR